MIPAGVRDAMRTWLRQQGPKNIQNWAETGASMADVLHSTWGSRLGLLRLVLSRRDVDQLRVTSDSDYEAFLDELLTLDPRTGAVFWQHHDWYMQQMQAVHRLLMQALGSAP